MTEDRGYLPAELEQFDRNIERVSDDLRHKGIYERAAAGWLRQEVKLRTAWDEHDNRMRLKDRIDHVKAIRTRLQEMFDLVQAERGNLQASKDRLDRGLTNRHELIMNVNGECQTLCDAREGINNVHDEVEERLRQEQELAAFIRRELERKIQEAIKVQEDLQNCQHLLTKDLEDKDQTLNTDQAQLALNTASYGLSLKPDILRIPKGMKTMRGWLEHSLENVRLAAKLLDRSTVLRNNVTALFSKVMHDFDTKIHATDFAYRKRYHDTVQAARRLEHNRQNLVTELKAVENDIQATEKGHEDVLPWKKLCHTRLENRNQRPNSELCMDIPQEGLLLEASNHRHSREGLFQKITELRSRWNDLSEQLHRVELDLDRKQKCLEMDKRAVDLRQGTFLPEAEKDVIDWVVDRGTKVFSMDPDQRYKKHIPKVLV